MSAEYNAEADELLQGLHWLACPGPQQLLPGKPLTMYASPDEARSLVQACGVLYERDQVSLITDGQYDRLARWLGDPAATAMDWRTYPAEVRVLAGRLREAAAWREAVLAGGRTCHCEEWDWAPHGCWETE